MPEVLDLNGDSQNSIVLARRARWAGLPARVHPLALGEMPPQSAPDLIVVGSGSEASIPAVLDGLWAIESPLREWVDSWVPLLAVGTGWELLARSVVLADGSTRTGLGIFSGRSVPSARVSDDLVVASQFGRLIGFENHARDYLPEPDAKSLGAVIYGSGNGGEIGRRAEGERVGACVGTHLHGPVLAKNPGLADHLLGLATVSNYQATGQDAVRVDAIARTARKRIAAQLGLGPE